ncbi:hypothetical protein VCV18_009087 [Metarhizium anisopliae]
MYKEGKKFGHWNFSDKFTLAERIEAFATDRPLVALDEEKLEVFFFSINQRPISQVHMDRIWIVAIFRY